MEDSINLIAKSFGLEKVKFNEKLSNHTALKIGGPAKLFAVAVSERELIKIVEYCQDLRVPFLVIGTGSKIAISDVGFGGVIIKNRTQNIRIASIKGKVSKSNTGNKLGVDSVLLEIEGGVIMTKLVDFLKRQGLEYEDFSTVSGSMGGNAAINRSLQEKCESVKILNSDGSIEIISPKNLSLREHIILSVMLRIKAK